MAAIGVGSAATAGRKLAESRHHRRLADRAQRLEHVVAALDERVKAREAAGCVPEPLRQALAGLRLELDELRGRLALGHDR